MKSSKEFMCDESYGPSGKNCDLKSVIGSAIISAVKELLTERNDEKESLKKTSKKK